MGALEVLEEKDLLRSVTEYVGVSAGAFVCFTVVLGYTLKEIRLLCSLYDFSRIRNLEPEAAFAFPTTFGLDDGANLVKLLETLMRHKNISTEMTFGGWLQTHPHQPQLRCFATDLFETRTREFSASKTPMIRLVDALRATMSLPGYFLPVADVETGHMLTDGGILHNFPLAFLPAHERSISLGISFSYDHTQVASIPDISTFLSQVFACYYIPRMNEVHNKNKERCIIIPCGHVPAWNFEATSEERLDLIQAGRKAARDFFDTYNGRLAGRKPVRRYSVS